FLCICARPLADTERQRKNDRGEKPRLPAQLADPIMNVLKYAFHSGPPSHGNDLAYFSQDSQHADDLWVTDFQFHQPRRLTHLNPLLHDHEMGATKLIDFGSTCR